MKRALLCIILLHALSAGVSAKTPYNLSANPEREIVSTATRYPEPGSGIPAYITVVTEDEIRNSPANNLPDLLRSVAGVQVSDIGGNRRSYLVDLRGFGATARQTTLILVDGRRVNTSDSTGTDWTHIPIERVKKIEIVRGGRGAVLFGDNTDGGVINIITDSSSFSAPAAPALSYGLGSYGTTKGSVNISGRTKTFSFGFLGNLLESGGYRDNGAVDSMDFGLNASYTIPGAGGIFFRSGFHQEKTGSPGLIKGTDLSGGKSRTSASTPGDYTDATDYYFHSRPELALGDKLYVSADISFRKRETESVSESVLKDTLADTFIFTPQLLFNIAGKGYTNRMLFGWDYRDTQEWITRSGETKTGNYNFGNKVSGYFIHDDLVFADRFSLSAGLRKEETDSTFYPITEERLTANAESRTAGINYNYGDGSNAYFNYSNGYRFPLGEELYDLDTESVDTSLKIQDSSSTELGFKRQVSPEAFYTLNLFRLKIENEIVSDDAVNGGVVNLDGTTKREGIEFSYTANPGLYIATLSWVYKTAEVESGSYSGKKIPGCAENNGSFNIAWRLGDGMVLAVTGNYTGERFFFGDFENVFGKQEPFTVYNARIAQKVGKLSTSIDINNFTNAEYSEYGALTGATKEKAYHPSPGRNYYLEITYEF